MRISAEKKKRMPFKKNERVFGIFTDSDKILKTARIFDLDNGKISVQVTNYGAAIVSIKVPDFKNKVDDIVLGYDDIHSYVSDKYYLGSTIGRFANRISQGKFSVQGQEYSLAVNNSPNHLHGGVKGFNKVLWEYSLDFNKVVFSYTSPALEENYPGRLKCTVTYELTDDNELNMQYYATTTEKTPVNITNHSYFNLGGHASGAVYDHLIYINADYYIPVDNTSIPTGEILSVTGTPFDVRKPRTIFSILNEIPIGVDHTFCINGNEGKEKLVARVEHPKSGRIMEIYSTQPGVQFYTANFLPLDSSLKGKNNELYKKHGAFCLETQNFPDAVNHMNFPNAFIEEGEEYKHTTKIHFSVKVNQ